MIEILSFSWGQANLGTAGTGGGAGAGAVAKQDLVVTKHVDKSSNVLAQGCAAGVHYTSATLYVRKSGGDPLDYLQYRPGRRGIHLRLQRKWHGRRRRRPGRDVSLDFTTLMVDLQPAGRHRCRRRSRASGLRLRAIDEDVGWMSPHGCPRATRPRAEVV